MGAPDLVLPVGLGQVFVRGAYLGQTLKRPTWDGWLTCPSLVYFCPSCGDAWARLALPNERWLAHTSGCDRCPPFITPPGTLSFSWNWRKQLDELPEEAIKREFLLLVNYHLKELL